MYIYTDIVRIVAVPHFQKHPHGHLFSRGLVQVAGDVHLRGAAESAQHKRQKPYAGPVSVVGMVTSLPYMYLVRIS